MRDSKLSRRDLLRAPTVLAAGAIFAEPLAAAVPEPTPLSAAMIQAARSPNAARLFQSFLLSIEAQQGLVDAFGMCHSISL